VRLQPHDAVDHVHARVFEGLGPLDVGRLVEAGLQFHQRHHLLALLGRVDQGGHDRRVTRRSIQRLFDAHDLGVVAAWAMNISTESVKDS
jgi:hypothetical protein